MVKWETVRLPGPFKLMVHVLAQSLAFSIIVSVIVSAVRRQYASLGNRSQTIDNKPTLDQRPDSNLLLYGPPSKSDSEIQQFESRVRLSKLSSPKADCGTVVMVDKSSPVVPPQF